MITNRGANEIFEISPRFRRTVEDRVARPILVSQWAWKLGAPSFAPLRSVGGSEPYTTTHHRPSAYNYLLLAHNSS